MNYLDKLGFYEILKHLSAFSKTDIGKDLCLGLLPSNDATTVKEMLAEIEECVWLLDRCGSIPLVEFVFPKSCLPILESSGVLSHKALLDLALVFKLSSDLKQYFFNDYIDINDFPIMSGIFSSLYSNSSVIDRIYHCILDENTISDDASPNLQVIRKKQRMVEQDIKSKLNSLLHSSSYSKFIQENLVTIRNDRYVIPVKEEYRSQIKGFIHDISASGSTVFIEPISVFELNNELNNLRIEENIEIEKILQVLTSLFYPYIEELKTDIDTISRLDFLFAKANFSKSIKGSTPIINDKKEIHLINARHPLIDKDKVVPNSIDLGNDFSCLVITGPNTGGKTVTLKTVGLLTCMACSGLNIPADEHSSLFVFDNIFADIGDNQSIADSLSTFSSHMLNIVDITKKATKNSLILVDELGSGTDPLEGANLAISILEYFHSIGSLVIATTHYQELKKFALVKDGFKNASVEFDLETLSPTYKLLIGIPGKSNAFDISRKLGLNEDIINRAASMIDKQDVDIEELLKNIYDNKSQIEKEKNQINQELQKVQILRKNLEKDNSDLKAQEKEIIEKAKVEARNILLQAKDDANEIIKKMNEIQISSTSNSKLNELRNTLNKKVKEQTIINNQEANKSDILDRKDIIPNKVVFVSTLNQNGIILSNISKSDEVQVQVGSLKLNVNIKYLQKEKNGKNISKTITNNSLSSISKSRDAKTEINVIGKNIEEATFMIDKFLDDSVLAKLQTVKIVHGKGTGKLKNGIHQFLKKHPHVKSFRMGTFGEGEMGVTVVELK